MKLYFFSPLCKTITKNPMAILSPYSSSFLNTLFCNEEQDQQWSVVDHEDHEDEDEDELNQTTITYSLCWEHDELVHLFTKEQEQEQEMQDPYGFSFDKTSPSVFIARSEAVDWILKVKCYYGFTTLTAILAINYLDRFLFSYHFQKDKQAWMIQLVAVSCLSLAAKIEETHVPLLLDLQVDESKFLFEAKNIQKMELLVMSTLKWRMNPVTPISFLDHIVRRLGLSNHVHWDFFKKCEAMILYLVTDYSRFMCYKPSVLATSTMLCVVEEIDPTNSIGYKSQLLDLLKTTEVNINECYKLVMELSHDNNHNKRKRDENEATIYPVSPAGVIGFTCDESSNESWDFGAHESSLKKTRTDQELGFGSLVGFEALAKHTVPII